MSAVRALRREQSLPEEARKLLEFTDNRQDAFAAGTATSTISIEIGLLRSCAVACGQPSGSVGSATRGFAQARVRRAQLELAHFAQNPQVEYTFSAGDRARSALGYYVYRDLRRGWRITSPNLEQSGLLRSTTHRWMLSVRAKSTGLGFTWPWPRLPRGAQPGLQGAFDFMRRELAIRVGFLDPIEQESIRRLSGQYLIAPWSLDEHGSWNVAIVFPSGRGQSVKPATAVYVSPLGGFGFVPEASWNAAAVHRQVQDGDVERIIIIFSALQIPGLVQRVIEPKKKEDAAGYQMNALALVWRVGSGQSAFTIDASRAQTESRESFLYQLLPTRLCRPGGRYRRGSTPPSACRRAAGTRRFLLAGRLPFSIVPRRWSWAFDIADLNVVRFAQRPTDSRQLRSAQRACGLQWSAGAGLAVLLGRQPARSVLLQSAL